MTKTHAEFLEKLKKYVDEQVCRLDNIKRTWFGDGSLIAYVHIQKEIEQFEAEQNQSKEQDIFDKQQLDEEEQQLSDSLERGE